MTEERTNGIKNRLEKAKAKLEFVKLIFIYPNLDRPLFKRGYVIATYDNSFDFKEKIDGLVTYSYNYLNEILVEKGAGDNNGKP